MSNSEKSNSIPKFEKLSYGTLRRYQTYFNIKDDKNSKDKNEIAKLVKKHFINMEIDYDRVLDTFVKIEKDQNSDKNNAIRKSIRFQEKNIGKFLDNLNNVK